MKTPLIFYSSVYRTVGRGGLTEGFTFHLRKHLHTYTYFGSEKYFVEFFFFGLKYFLSEFLRSNCDGKKHKPMKEVL